ncbi:DNA-binding protein [Streptococcus fryi]
MKLKYVSVENAVAEWGDKKSLLKRWEGLNQYTLNRWITEMRDHRQFSQYVINPTHKLVFINLDGFEEFLRWKQRIAVK